MNVDKFNAQFYKAIEQINNNNCKCEKCNKPILNEEDFSASESSIICLYCFDIQVAFLKEGLDIIE